MLFSVCALLRKDRETCFYSAHCKKLNKMYPHMHWHFSLPLTLHQVQFRVKLQVFIVLQSLQEHEYVELG